MPTRVIYHVTPAAVGWQVKRGRSHRASSMHPTKAQALRAAADLATSHPRAQVVVHDASGVIIADRLYDRAAHRRKQAEKAKVKKAAETRKRNAARAARDRRKRRTAALLGVRRRARRTRAFSAAVRAGLRRSRS